MPIASFKPDTDSSNLVKLPSVQPEVYKGIVVDDSSVPLNSLISYIEGAPWTITYYSQIVGQHNDLRDHDPTQNSIYQLYSKVIDLEIRVTTPISSSQDSLSTALTVTGSALMFPFMTPNVSDMFIADVGDNNKGLFRIINVERKIFNRDSVYSIDYDLVAYVDNEPIRISDLESKVARVYYFHRDRLISGINPNVLDTEHQQILDLKDRLDTITRYYFKTFYNREYSTLILPGQSVSVYDSYLVQYLLKIFSTNDADELIHIRNLPTEGDPYMDQPQFWSAMINRDYTILSRCNRRMGLAPVAAFGYDPLLHGLRYTRIQYIIYPVNGDQSVFSESTPILKPTSTVSVTSTLEGRSTLQSIIENNYVDTNTMIPVIHPVLYDDCYVLSEAFYNDSPHLTLLEALTLDYLHHRALNKDKLLLLADRSMNWSRLDQYYYIPIIITLINILLKT